MSKAARLRTERNRNRRVKRGGVFPDFPYDHAFEKGEIEQILARQERLARLFRDAIGPDGVTIGMDEGTFQKLMLHGALVGLDDTPDREERALIRSKRLPDASGRFVDAVEWILKSEDTEKARKQDAEEEARRRKAAMDVHLKQMTPDVRDAYDRLFAPAAEKAFTQAATTAAKHLENAETEPEEARELREEAERLRREGKL